MFQSYNGVYIKQEPCEEYSATSSSNHMFDAQSHHSSPNHEIRCKGKYSVTGNSDSYSYHYQKYPDNTLYYPVSNPYTLGKKIHFINETEHLPISAVSQFLNSHQQCQTQSDVVRNSECKSETADGIPESTLSRYCSKPKYNELIPEEGFNKTEREIKMEKSEISSKLSLPKKRKKVGKITDCFKQTKKVDRFNGMPEEDVLHRKLPDHLAENLDIVIIGFNPGLCAAYKGHHYAGPGNHFWKCLFLSGLIPQPMTAMDDYKLIEYGIGFTNIVERTTRSSADLTRKELKEGAVILIKKLQNFAPKIAVFNGKGIYEIFCGKKNFKLGMQPECIENSNTRIFVMPSSSARCAQLPRAVDKLPFYVALGKLRDHLHGKLPDLDLSEVTFDDYILKIKVKEEETIAEEEPEMTSKYFHAKSQMTQHSPLPKAQT